MKTTTKTLLSIAAITLLAACSNSGTNDTDATTSGSGMNTEDTSDMNHKHGGMEDSVNNRVPEGRTTSGGQTTSASTAGGSTGTTTGTTSTTNP
jgi:hypothetical protein